MIWYEIKEWPGYRINHQRRVLSLRGESPRLLKAGPVVTLRKDGRYVRVRVEELMRLAGLSTPLPPLQIHHEAARDRCDQGHLFSPENTMWRRGRNGNKIRKCRRCHAQAVARWRAKKKV